MNNSTSQNSENNTNKKISTRILVEGAVMVALSAGLSFIKIIDFPWGGSVTLLSMLPVIFFSIKRGVKAGFTASFVYALFQLFQGALDGVFGWGLTPLMLCICILCDYIGAFAILGIAGLFRKKGLVGCISGTALAIVGRFLFHFAGGIVVWGTIGKIWDTFSTDNKVIYSLVYNGAYMLPELVLTIIGAVILLLTPQIKKLLNE